MKKLAEVNYILLLLAVLFNFTFAQDMDPEAAKAFNAGNDFLKAGNYIAAVESYNKALNITPDYRIYYQKGIALKKADKLEESKAALEACINANPNFDIGYNALGGTYFAKGEMEKAIANFEKVIEVSKNNSLKSKVKEYISRSYAKLGTNAINDGNTDKAVEHLNKAIENYNYDAAYLSLAKLYSELAAYDKAISAAENALKYRASISKGGPYYYLGVAYKGKGDVQKSKDNFNLAKSDVTYKRLAEYELGLLK